MSDATFDGAGETGGPPDDLLERLFGAQRLRRGWRVLVPANDDSQSQEAFDAAFINALFKRRRSW